MILLFILGLILFYIIFTIIINFFTKKYGKLSYDGFSAIGFAYSSEKDIFYSTKNAWQKNFGYTHLYDVLAPLFRIILDTETVKFNYNGKNWLISFWKGQYGIVTGGEVGIYNTTQKKVDNSTVYFPVLDNEMLKSSFRLYKKGKLIAYVKAKHWWLAVFKLAMFSNPKDLTMYITIDFPNKEMLSTFLVAFKKLGYKEKDYKIIDKTFLFIFDRARTKKVWTRQYIPDLIRQYFNKRNVNLYNKYLSQMIETNHIDDSNSNNKILFINDLIPEVLKNNKENTKYVINKLYNQKEEKIIVLNKNVYSQLRKKNL